MSEPSPRSPILPKSLDSANDSPISRRDFGLRAAMAAVTLPSLTMLGCNIGPVQESKTGENSPDKNSGGLTPDQAQEVEARLANIVRKYGNRLSEQQRQHLRRILKYNESMLASIRTFSLQNGDPPASVLKISVLSHAGSAKSSVAATGKPRDGLSASEPGQA